MAQKVLQEHGGAINQLQKGESGNYAGRPRKYISELKAQGYSQSEVKDCILVILSMNKDELTEASKNPNLTVLERIVIGAIQKDISRGSAFNLELFLSRAHGKPQESIDMTTKGQQLITAIQINHVYLTKEELEAKELNEAH